MKTLFAQTFSAILGSLFVLLLLMAVLFSLGVRRSISDWNFYRDQRLQNVIIPVLSRTYREFGSFDRENVEQSLTDFLTQNQFVYVFDAEREPVFLYARGDLLDPADYEMTDSGNVENLPGARPPSALIQNDEVVGYLSAGSLGFTSDLANQRFLRSMALSAVIGVIVSFALASAAAVVFSRAMSRHASNLSNGLRRLAEGEREVSFPTGGAQELQSIGESASALQEQLSNEERLRRQWTQDIAHDLRTPVAALKAQFELLQEGIVEPTPERLTAVYGEVERIDELVNDLRELSRLESPEMKLVPAEIDLPGFIRRLEARFRPLAEERGIELVVRVEDGVVIADEHMLSRALSNIMVNALQHTESGGRIVFDTSWEDGRVSCVVSNTGSVNENDIPHVFDRLYRGENSRGSRGSGLGLSITKAIAEAHDGSVAMRQNGDFTEVLFSVNAYGPD
ncbi:MAG: sensor histidine kinase [Spirochaetales bacterium]